MLLKTGAEGGGRVKDISKWSSVEKKLHLLTTTHRLSLKVCQSPFPSFFARYLIETPYVQAKFNQSSHTPGNLLVSLHAFGGLDSAGFFTGISKYKAVKSLASKNSLVILHSFIPFYLLLIQMSFSGYATMLDQ